MRKLWRGFLTLAISLPLLGSGHALALGSFAGVTAFSITDANSRKPVLAISADMPFEYKVQPLNRNQVLITLVNARMADGLVTEDGLLSIPKSKGIESGTIKVSDNPNNEELVLNGPGLGEKQFRIKTITSADSGSAIATTPRRPVDFPATRPQNAPRIDIPDLNTPTTEGGSPDVAQAYPTEQPTQDDQPRQVGAWRDLPPITFTVANANQPYHLTHPDLLNEQEQNGAGEDSYSAVAYATPAPNKAKLALSQALTAYKQGSIPEALKTLETALSQCTPQEEGALRRALAEVQIAANRLSDAALTLRRAIPLAGRSEAPTLRLRYAEVLILSQQKSTAQRELTTLLTESGNLAGSDRGKAHYMLGTLLEEAGNTAEAIPHLEEAARLSTADASVFYNLGLAYEFEGRLQQAISAYQKAVRLNPDAPDIQKALARMAG
ncbi:MAG: tetratricopeptide repeat protein [Candidatus Melainabacteria bacterium]